jgi:anti-sigma factor RsiW
MGPRDGLRKQRLMSCQNVQESISSYLDNRLTEPERTSVARHLAGCDACAALHVQTAKLRHNLQSLAPVAAPKKLTVEVLPRRPSCS